ncbi:MAG: hypothetical protein A2V88_05145 [Elusimicrobia bacterium RBG_16_66_12]|nr:MAG: hypothetical protein A2V88_05145 [Elusimicrobia bacterium RBG_16_66_12]
MKNISRSRVLLAWIMALPGSAAWCQESWVAPSGQELLQKIQAATKTAARQVQRPAGVSAKKQTFQDILDEVYQGREPGSDLSAAAPDRRFYFDLHVQYRDGTNEEFKDYRNRRAEHILIIPDLIAVDPFWSGFVPVGDAIFTRMESLYFFNFRVVGATLHYHRIFQEMVWPKGETPPLGREMDTVEHGGQTLQPRQRTVITRVIGKREYRITLGFTVE